MLPQRLLRPLIVSVLVVLALGATPAGASAQDEVIVDPESPAGTEYVIPFESARRDSAPPPSEQGGTGGSSGAGDSSSAGSAPAFGAGVEPDGAGRKGRAGKGNGAAASGGVTSADATGAVAALTNPADGGVPVGLITAGAALSVLLLAGAVRLTQRRSPD